MKSAFQRVTQRRDGMTCHDCGMTIGWDCECDPEYNALLDNADDQERRSLRASRERPNLAQEFNDLTEALGLGRRLYE